jgi:hypothetical protein
MSRYILIRRLYGPAFLLLTGVNALLSQAHILSWNKTWPFYLILWGVLKLAERAALASEGYPQWPATPPQPGWQPQGNPYPGSPNAGTPYPGAPQNAAPQQTPAQPAPLSALIPSIAVEIVKKPEGGEQ